MSIKKTTSILICLFSFASVLNAQSLSKKEGLSINHTIDGFLSKNDYNYKNRNPEFILILLETDSNGYIYRINFLSDEKNRDTTYAILSKMTPDLFKTGKFLNCRSKLILIPFYSDGPGKQASYMNKIFRRTEEIYEDKGLIINYSIKYLIPQTQQ